MSNYVEYRDILAFHPGYYVLDVMESMNMSQEELAIRLDTTPKTISKLVNGQINLSDDLARKLSIMLGTSMDVWLNLQKNYDEKIQEIKLLKEMDEQIELAKMIDYNYFVRYAGLQETRSINERIKNLCQYFKVADLRVLKSPDLLVNYRTGVSHLEEKNIVNSRAWLQTAINMSEKIETEPFDIKRILDFLPIIRSMTIQEPEDFIPALEKVFAYCGVAFVILPHLKNSGINGAVKWINKDRVVLAVNNRGLDADKFWFSLFHEIRHVMQRRIKTVFINTDESFLAEINEDWENDADKFATDYLIPRPNLDRFAPNKYTSDKEIIEFAKSIGIHPGIVVGRLQHDGIIPQSRGVKLKKKYSSESLMINVNK